MRPQWQFAELDERAIRRVQSLEEEMEAVVLVMEQRYPHAVLTPEQLARIQTLEAELGVVLVAYKA